MVNHRLAGTNGHTGGPMMDPVHDRTSAPFAAEVSR
jgi:hypothetical protein